MIKSNKLFFMCINFQFYSSIFILNKQYIPMNKYILCHIIGLNEQIKDKFINDVSKINNIIVKDFDYITDKLRADKELSKIETKIHNLKSKLKDKNNNNNNIKLEYKKLTEKYN